MPSWTTFSGYRQQYYLHYIHDALYAFAHALIEVHMDACGKDFKGVCEAMKPGNMSGTKLLEYLEDVQFRGNYQLLTCWIVWRKQETMWSVFARHCESAGGWKHSARNIKKVVYGECLME